MGPKCGFRRRGGLFVSMEFVMVWCGVGYSVIDFLAAGEAVPLFGAMGHNALHG